MISAREEQIEFEKRLEEKVQQERNDGQYDIVKRSMHEYHEALRRVDTTSLTDLQDQLAEVNKNIDGFKQGKKAMKGLPKSAQTSAITSQISWFEEQLTQYEEKRNGLRDDLKNLKKGSTSKDDAIELIINRYNGTTDVILPVRDDDVATRENGVHARLYDAVYKALDNEFGVAAESLFEGYKVISVNKSDLEDIFKQSGPKDVSEDHMIKYMGQEIMDGLPEEFTRAKNPTIYVHMARDFCFSYEKSQDSTVVKKPVEEKKRPSAPTVPPPNAESPSVAELTTPEQVRGGIQDLWRTGEWTIGVSGPKVADLRGKYEIPGYDDQQLAGYLATTHTALKQGRIQL